MIGEKIFKLLAVTFTALLLMTACEKESVINNPVVPDNEEENPVPGKNETLVERLLGTYQCTMHATKVNREDFPPDDLYLFLVTSQTNAPDSLKVEVRLWYSSMMPHDLGYSVTFGLKENKDGPIRGIAKGMDYTVYGIPGVDKNADSTIMITFNEKGEPQFDSKFQLYKYEYLMRVNSKERKSRKVLPNATSTIIR